MKKFSTRSKRFLTIIFFLALSILVLLLATKKVIWHLPSPLQQNENINLPAISAENVEMLEKSFSLSDTNKRPVYKISVSKEMNIISVIYGNGELLQWDIKKRKIVNNYKLVVSSQKSINFNEEGDKVIVPCKITNKGEISKIIVLDTKSGTDYFCDGDQQECPLGLHWKDEPQVGYYLDSSGQWLYSFSLLELDNSAHFLSEFSVQSTNVNSQYQNSSVVLLGNEYIDDSNAEVAMLITDQNSEYIIFALNNGLVRITNNYLIDYKNNTSYDRDLLDGLESYRVEYIDMEIDNTESWLAILREDKLLVWRIQNNNYSLAIDKTITNGTSLAFDRTGKLLAVGTDKNIIIFNLINVNNIESLKTEKTTDLIFSIDNQMLISGDSMGHLTIWEILK